MLNSFSALWSRRVIIKRGSHSHPCFNCSYRWLLPEKYVFPSGKLVQAKNHSLLLHNKSCGCHTPLRPPPTCKHNWLDIGPEAVETGSLVVLTQHFSDATSPSSSSSLIVWTAEKQKAKATGYVVPTWCLMIIMLFQWNILGYKNKETEGTRSLSCCDSTSHANDRSLEVQLQERACPDDFQEWTV